MRRTSLCLMIALALGACSDSDSGPRLASIDELRVVKVSGDQVSPVRGQQVAASRIHAVAGASYSIGPDGYTSEPLVARVEVASQAKGGGTGPSGAVIPTGTLVHWHIPSRAGKLYAATTATDDSAHVINRWAPGTRAGEFQVTAGRLIGAEIVTDETWTLVVEPGPLARWQGANGTPFGHPLHIGDTLDLRALVERAWDDHNNEIPVEEIRSLPDSLVEWTWSEFANTPELLHTGAGWTTEVPDAVTLGYWHRTFIDYIVPRERIWCWQLRTSLRLSIRSATNSSNSRWNFSVAVPEAATSPDSDPLCRDLPPND